MCRMVSGNTCLRTYSTTCIYADPEWQTDWVCDVQV